MYNMFENIYKFFSRVFEILSLKIKPKKVEEFPAMCEPSVRVSSYAIAAAKKPEPAAQTQEQLPSGFQVLKTGDRIQKTEGKNNFNFKIIGFY